MKNKNNYLRTNAKKQAYKNKGITLIALIITIIILLILVGVSLNLLIKGDLFGSAEKAVEGTNAKVEEQQTAVDELMGELDEVEKEIEEQQRQDNLPGTRVSENTKYIRDGKTAWIPKGFTVSGIKSEQSINKGLVIYDIPEGTTPDWSNPDSVKTKYNQFVWIPVEVNKTTEPKDTETSIASFYRTNWADNASTGGERTTGLSTNDTEPYSKDSSDYDGTGTGKTGISAQITELTKSIYKYGGFYIGRYEVGSETARIDGSSQTAAFVVQQDKYPYNWVKWGKGMGDISEGAVYLSNSLYTGKTGYGVKSMLCTGAAWDSMLDFIKDSSHNVTSSSSWGNYDDSDTYKVYRGSLSSDYGSTWSAADTTNGSDVTKDTSILLTTGATERNSSKNIYDVAGNCWEWTTEASYTFSRVLRGGSYGNNGSSSPASNRNNSSPTFSNNDNSFRPLLYVAL